MLNNISWASYVNAITIIVFIYYGFVLVAYYRNDLQNKLLKIKPTFTGSSTNRHLQTEKKDVEEKEKDIADEPNQNDSVADLLLSLQTLIKNGATRNFPREELLLSLQLQLQLYPVLKDSIHTDNINNFIISECKNYCSMHLNVDEVSVLWNK